MTPEEAPIFAGDPELFAKHFEREVFQFSHRLAKKPLFELVGLARLVKAQAPEDLYYEARSVNDWTRLGRAL